MLPSEHNDLDQDAKSSNPDPKLDRLQNLVNWATFHPSVKIIKLRSQFARDTLHNVN